jgi:predicted enzyme related to lactoylglutathione lyase
MILSVREWGGGDRVAEVVRRQPGSMPSRTSALTLPNTLTGGMFDKNILTFNPGWDSNAQKLAAFTDVRDLQRQLKAQGVQLVNEANESTTGPASFIAVDPDGNPILVDQHV